MLKQVFTFTRYYTPPPPQNASKYPLVGRRAGVYIYIYISMYGRVCVCFFVCGYTLSRVVYIDTLLLYGRYHRLRFLYGRNSSIYYYYYYYTHIYWLRCLICVSCVSLYNLRPSIKGQLHNAPHCYLLFLYIVYMYNIYIYIYAAVDSKIRV